MIQTRIREARVLAAAASVVALGGIFAAAGGLIPATTLPRIEGLPGIVPELNALLSLGAIACIGYGVAAIRQGRVRRHQAAMSAAFVQFMAFLALYLYKVILEGPTAFPGPEFLYTYLYLPLLGVHILLAMICVPLLFYVLALAGLHPVEQISRTDHRRVGRVAAVLWVISFVLGLAVYGLLYVLY
ncbi:MAG: DUF420 domain-containing protein [Halobacteriaceae archaeon]